MSDIRAEAERVKDEQEPKMDISKMVDRFLSWPLPKTFAPDSGISFKKLDNPNLWPIGTNLFTADEARQMLEYVLGGELQTYRKALDEIIATSDDAESVRIAHEAITPYTEWKVADESEEMKIDLAAEVKDEPQGRSAPPRWRQEVVDFADAMELKLRQNDHKAHWRGMGLQFLSMRLTQERKELQAAIARGDPNEILAEAADVANFAMMIADVCKGSAQDQRGAESAIGGHKATAPGNEEVRPVPTKPTAPHQQEKE